MSNEDFQRPNIYNQYLPCGRMIAEQASLVFEEIRKNLSRCVQLNEFRPGFATWSYKLKEFIQIYGFSFNKVNHIKLIEFYLSVLTIDDLNCLDTFLICFDMLNELLLKARLIHRDDLTIDWRILYRWAELVIRPHDNFYGLMVFPKNFKSSITQCVYLCSPYFLPEATEQILDLIYPYMCHIESTAMSTAVELLELLLPLSLPPSSHHQGFKLWLMDIFDIWENIYNNIASWEAHMIRLFTRLAWYNIGYIDWEPWFPKIFTRILRGFSLPVGTQQLSTSKSSYSAFRVAQWIVAMIGNSNSCLQYLRDLLVALKSFYHPSNTGRFQKQLVEFISNLAYYFVRRVHLEQKTLPAWFFVPNESHRLTEQDITNFVDCLKEYAFMSIFNKTYRRDAIEACQYLAMLRPEMIVSPIVDKLLLSVDNLNEAHRFTSLMHCLTSVARQLVRSTPLYPQGQTYVVPIILSVLPGIDLNDHDKLSKTLDCLDAIFQLISCVDCSSAVHSRHDLTKIEIDVCKSTAKFEEFMNKFLDRIFDMITTLSMDVLDSGLSNEDQKDLANIKTKLGSIMMNILQRCDNKIYQIVQHRITKFVKGSIFLPNAQLIVTKLIQAMLLTHPTETLDSLLPATCRSIKKILDEFGKSLLDDYRADLELTSHLTLFSDLISARGDALLPYRDMINSVFHLCLPSCNKDINRIISGATTRFLQSLLYVYSLFESSIKKHVNESFTDTLPIRTWGQNIDFDKFHIDYHIPNVEEIDLACDFVNTFIYQELALLNENSLNMTKEQRRRSLVIIYNIAVGCVRVVPRMESKDLQYNMTTMVPPTVQSQSLYHKYFDHSNLKFRENIRTRLLVDIGHLLDKLIETQSDDVTSIKKALDIYVLTSGCSGVYLQYVSEQRKSIHSERKLFRNEIIGELDNPHSLVAKQVMLQFQEFECQNFRFLTEIDKQIGLKLFDLSISRYSAVRRHAQDKLFTFINYYLFSYEILVDRISELLASSIDTDDSQIKGCLYVLDGGKNLFIPTRHSWAMRRKLWPLIARRCHTKKPSSEQLMHSIKTKLEKDFSTIPLTAAANEFSKQVAIALWCPVESTEFEMGTQFHEERCQTALLSYKELINELCLLLNDETLKGGPKRMAMSLLCLMIQKNSPIPSSCIETCLHFLVHDTAELRKHAIKAIAAFGRLQKPPRIFVEKPAEEILEKFGHSKGTVVNDKLQPGNREDNLWITYNNYTPPETQTEWEQMCFLDNIYYGYYRWPKTIKYSVNKRERYTSDQMPEVVSIVFERFQNKDFIRKLIKVVVIDEPTNKFTTIRFLMYKGLFRNFGLAFVDNFIECVYELIHETSREKYEGSHRAAAEIIAGMIRGSKYWTLEMLNVLWEKLTPLLTEITTNLNRENYSYWSTCFRTSLTNTDPRRMFRPIQYLCTLINDQVGSNSTYEIFRWNLIDALRAVWWRIPSIWALIHEKSKELIDHSSKPLRDRLAFILAMSFGINLISSRYPSVIEFIDTLGERLRRAIEVHQSNPLVNLSATSVELDAKTEKALNLIETVIDIHLILFDLCHKPINESIVLLLPSLCEIGSISTKDDTFQNRVKVARARIAMTYVNVKLFEKLVEQLETVCVTPRWHARRAAVEFIQYLIFCNFFNVQPYAKRLHTLILNRLVDEQLEVRLMAMKTLTVFYQCGYKLITEEDLQHFLTMTTTEYKTLVNGKTVISMQDVIRRHGGILGLTAIVLAHPYDIPSYVPKALIALSKHSHDHKLIQESIRNCMSEFHRTHHDSWAEHRTKFNDAQLEIIADALIPHSYYT